MFNSSLFLTDAALGIKWCQHVLFHLSAFQFLVHIWYLKIVLFLSKCNAGFLIIVHLKLLDGVNLYLRELWGTSDANTCCFTCLLSNSGPQLILHKVHFRLYIFLKKLDWMVVELRNFLKVLHFLLFSQESSNLKFCSNGHEIQNC